MNRYFKIISLFIMFLSIQSFANSNLSVEIDPSTYAFQGYSAHLRYHLSNGWVASLGTYKMEFPKLLNPMVFDKNLDSSTIRIDSAVGLFLDKYFASKSEGLFAGVQLAQQKYVLKQDAISGADVSYTANLIMPRIGYRYNINESLYLLPWLGIGYLDLTNRKPLVGTEVYELKSVIPFATLHLGYSF